MTFIRKKTETLHVLYVVSKVWLRPATLEWNTQKHSMMSHTLEAEKKWAHYNNVNPQVEWTCSFEKGKRIVCIIWCTHVNILIFIHKFYCTYACNFREPQKKNITWNYRFRLILFCIQHCCSFFQLFINNLSFPVKIIKNKPQFMKRFLLFWFY